MKLTNVVKDDKLPLRDDKVIKPWELLSVDLCGPWKIKCEFEEAEEGVQLQTRRVKIWTLTMIDEGSSWPEIAAIENKYAEEITTLVDDIWFARYPRPLYYIHDNGGEFIGSVFRKLLESYGVKPKPTTVKNPQGNGLHERMHLVLYEMLRTQQLHVPKESTVAREINRILQCIVRAMKTTPNMITKYSPGNIVFDRDMLFHKTVIADWELIHSRRREQQIRDNDRENRSRTKYKYIVGDKVRIVTTVRERKENLFGYEHKGPYDIMAVHNNGTVTIKCGNFNERINIRRLKLVQTRTK